MIDAHTPPDAGSVSVASSVPLLLDFAPWQLSGLVVGTLFNDGAALAALGDVVHAAPYGAPPRAPVLYIKPRNTLAPPRASLRLPLQAANGIEVGANLGLVIGRTACRVPAAQAAAHVAGLVIVADLGLPHASYYRPALRCKALDGSCRIGIALPCSGLPELQQLVTRVEVDGRCVQDATMERYLRTPAQLLAEVSDFMTLRAGDLLLLGTPAGAPVVCAGQSVRISVGTLPPLHIAWEVVR